MKKLLFIFALIVCFTLTGQVNAPHQVNGSEIRTGTITYTFIHSVANVSGTTYTPALTVNVPLKLRPVMVSIETVGMTFAGDTLILPTAGDYVLQIFSDISSVNGDDFNISCRVNNVAISTSSWQGTTTGATNFNSISYLWYLNNIVANSNISLYITNLTNSNDPTIRRFKIFIQKIPE